MTTITVAMYCTTAPESKISVPLDFDRIRQGLYTLSDKTAYELVRLVRKHKTKERFMKLLSAYVQEFSSIPDMEGVARLVQIISDTCLGEDEVWS